MINGVCNYDILSNPKYADMYFYYPIDRRIENNIKSDIVV